MIITSTHCIALNLEIGIINEYKLIDLSTVDYLENLQLRTDDLNIDGLHVDNNPTPKGPCVFGLCNN